MPLHQTLTPAARKVVRSISGLDYVVHPGPIDPTGRRNGVLHVKLTIEPHRVRITVSSSGVQTLFIYGVVDESRLIESLSRTINPEHLRIHHPFDLTKRNDTVQKAINQ